MQTRVFLNDSFVKANLFSAHPLLETSKQTSHSLKHPKPGSRPSRRDESKEEPEIRKTKGVEASHKCASPLPHPVRPQTALIREPEFHEPQLWVEETINEAQSHTNGLSPEENDGVK